MKRRFYALLTVKKYFVSTYIRVLGIFSITLHHKTKTYNLHNANSSSF